MFIRTLLSAVSGESKSVDNFMSQLDDFYLPEHKCSVYTFTAFESFCSSSEIEQNTPDSGSVFSLRREANKKKSVFPAVGMCRTGVSTGSGWEPLFGPHLPAAVGEQEEPQRHGGTGHGVCGRHAVLGVVKHLQFDHGRRGGPRPPHQVLGALPQVHDPDPERDQAARDVRIHVPGEEREETNVEQLVAQLRAQREHVVQEPIRDHELVSHVSRQRVLAQRPARHSVLAGADVRRMCASAFPSGPVRLPVHGAVNILLLFHFILPIRSLPLVSAGVSRAGLVSGKRAPNTAHLLKPGDVLRVVQRPQQPR